MNENFLSISNDSALVFGSSVVCCEKDAQLVAAQVAVTESMLLKAIKATLANNNGKSWLRITEHQENGVTPSWFVKGARRGFKTVSSSMGRAGVQGSVSVLLHPLAGNPQDDTADHFYLVTVPGEEVNLKFVERLDLAIAWPVQPEWAEYLLAEGIQARLVEPLTLIGTDFQAGLRVAKDEPGWQQVISSGLAAGRIQIGG